MAIDFSRIKFFVEGKGDRVFIRDILKLWFDAAFTPTQLRELVIDCEGFYNLPKQLDEFRQTEPGQKREGGKNIVIFDADYFGREDFHGFNEKLAYLERKKNELGISFDLFLFPDNSSDGTIETLLETCINPEHSGIMNCWKGLEECITTGGNYTIPANKSKIYVYLECLHGGSNAEKEKIKDTNRDFTLADKWKLDYNKNPSLANLKIFLDQQLQGYYR